MKSAIITSCIVLSLISGHAYAQSKAGADIAPSSKRTAAVELAGRLAKISSAETLLVPDGLRNPFDPTAEAKSELKAGHPGSDKELLALLAEQLHPTGVMGRDESLVLLLKGQKGVKLNDKLTLSFDGAIYDVEVVAIDRNNFSLRYNQAEITRPIKTGKNP